MFGLPFFKKKTQETSAGPNLLAKDAVKPNKRVKKKEEPRRPWTHKDRLLVLGVLLVTVIFSLYFWYKGRGYNPYDMFIPSFFLKTPTFEETVILE